MQAYALQNILRKLNIYSEIIDYKPDILILPYDYKLCWKSIKKIGILRTIKFIIIKLPYIRKIKKRKALFEEFRKKNMVISSSTYFSSDELIASPPQYDYYITGSDQVWNPDFLRDTGNSYFLDFAPSESKKISYAASIALKIKPELYNMYKNNLERFNHISIREKEHLYLLHELTNKPVKVTLDPTLLIDKTEWMNLSKRPKINDKYILIYDIQYNDELVKLANRLSDEMNYKVISYLNYNYYKKGIKSFYYEGPCEFIGYIENAQFVLTTSYHGAIFSIIFNKPFYVIPHNKTGSRMINLLSSLGLEDRIVNNADDVINIIYDVDYKKTLELLQKEKEESMKFLINALDIDSNNYGGV